jgi:hypothetical protein
MARKLPPNACVKKLRNRHHPVEFDMPPPNSSSFFQLACLAADRPIPRAGSARATKITFTAFVGRNCKSQPIAT